MTFLGDQLNKRQFGALVWTWIGLAGYFGLLFWLLVIAVERGG